jgi:predicted N-formylglutamate amidohydrolase
LTRSTSLLVTCEHAGNRVPARYARLFRRHRRLLRSHRGWDPGTLALGRAIANRLHAPLIAHTVTRLLVEPNRSVLHPALFSAVTQGLPDHQRKLILDRYYLPHRRRVCEAVERLAPRGACVLHVGVHSFTPVLDGHVRNADVGLLYHPARPRERDFCRRWRQSLNTLAPDLRVRMNYPYLGKADGLTTALRRHFPPRRYLGIELEVNQVLLSNHHRFPGALTDTLIESLRQTLS